MTLSALLGTLGTTNLPLSIQQIFTFINGTGAGASNQVLALQGTLVGTAHVDIDFYANGSVADAVGNAMTMAVLKMLIIQNLGVISAPAVEADSMTIGGEGSTASLTSLLGTNTDSMTLKGGGIFIIGGNGAAGYTVGASTTNHKLRIAGVGANTITYNIIAIGATA